MVLVLATLVIQQAIAFSTKKIKPEFNKISPAENLKKKYGTKGLLDFLKDMAKMLFAGGLAAVFLYGFARHYYASSAVELGQFFNFTFTQVLTLFLIFGAFQFALAAVDLPLQRQLHAKLAEQRERTLLFPGFYHHDGNMGFNDQAQVVAGIHGVIGSVPHLAIPGMTGAGSPRKHRDRAAYHDRQ